LVLAVLPLSLAPLLFALAGGPMLQDGLRALAAQAAAVLERQRQERSGSDAPAYLAAAREVSNWRREAVQDLQPAPLSALAVLLQVERPVVTRCVKLNNYWCIKRARWKGEIGADEEGHTGFASADEGADAAVTLLRRYYLELGRKSALDIVRRWAPAECRGGAPSVSLPVLALSGIGMTLRARWLAAQRANAAPARRTRVASAVSGAGKPSRRPAAQSRVSVVPLRPLPSFRVPDIAVGLGERRVATLSATPTSAPKRRQPTPASVAAAQERTAARLAKPAPAKPIASAPLRPAPPPVRVASTASTAAPRPPVRACTPDEGRIRNYAARIVAGLDLGPSDDLKLFAPDGTPLPNLPRVMLAMSSVELGMLRASLELIESAIARSAPQTQTNLSLRPLEAAPTP